MKKIFSAALALVCVWFATPALADLDPCRNLFDGVWQSGIYSTTTGVYSSAENRVSNKNMIAVQPDTKYVASGDGVNAIRWLFYDSNKAFIRAVSGNQTITTPNGTKYINFYIAADYTVETAPRFQIEQGDTATEYVPYNPLCATCNGTIVNYVSATGTVSQSGTPTPDNPIYPTFYKQGDMVLRKVGDIADSYDATTGKITRRVGEYIFTGRESIDRQYNVYGVTTIPYDMNKVTNASLCSHNKTYVNTVVTNDRTFDKFLFFTNVNLVGFGVSDTPPEITNTETFKQWLAQQYAAGTPVTVWYPLAEETTEDWPASQCTTDPIKIATTKYNETKFSPLNTALQNAISVVDTVVSNTITQAGRIATLQAQKQTRPNDIADDNEKCPAGKKCLLVTDTAGTPHWYEIVENAPLLPNGYTELEYITFNGTQELDTGFTPNQDTRIESKIYGATNANMWIYGTGVSNPRITAYLASSGNQRFGNKTVDSTGITGETLATIVQDKNVFNWNGNTKTYDSQSNFTALTSLTIGNSNGSTGTPYFSGNFYYMKIYDNEILVRDYVPAQDSNNNVGLFDRVNNVFLTAEGLVAGAIVE